MPEKAVACAMVVYSVGPIDYWLGWQSEADYLNSIANWGDCFDHADEYVDLKAEAFRLARLVWWEGDIREGPFVSALPFPDYNISKLVIAWKQDNNGTTFIASPVRMPWLDGETWVEQKPNGEVVRSRA